MIMALKHGVDLHQEQQPLVQCAALGWVTTCQCPDISITSHAGALWCFNE